MPPIARINQMLAEDNLIPEERAELIHNRAELQALR
jgi:hypothetical protein